MAKRYSDSRKWQKAWFRHLSKSEKLYWIFILDHCDHAGIWEVDFEFVSIFIEDLDESMIRDKFSKQYVEFSGGKRWFIKDFIDFQYGELNDNNRVHKSVIQILKKYNLYKRLKRAVDGPKDKDEDTDQVKDEVKDKKSDQLKVIYGELKEIQMANKSKNVSQEYEKWTDWMLAHGKTYKNYKAAFRNWLKNDFGGNSRSADVPFVRDPEYLKGCPKKDCTYERKMSIDARGVCPTHKEGLI